MTPPGEGASLTLADEELEVLVPGVRPLPYLDTVPTAARDAVLVSTARQLLVRGLADPGEVLTPAPELVPLLAPLWSTGPQVQVAPLDAADAEVLLTVLRPLPDGDVHVHDVGVDGVHLLTVLGAADAEAQLCEALAAAEEQPGGGPRAVLALRPGQPPAERLLVSRDGARWCATGDGAPQPLDPGALQELAALLLRP